VTRGRVCAHCGEPIGADRHERTRFCKTRCRVAAHRAAQRAATAGPSAPLNGAEVVDRSAQAHVTHSYALLRRSRDAEGQVGHRREPDEGDLLALTAGALPAATVLQLAGGVA